MSYKMSDILRIPNTDVSNILCMEYDNKIYMKESVILDLVESNGISEDGIESLCRFIIESNEFGEDAEFKLIRDRNSIGIIDESYSYNPEMDDTIMNLFEIHEILATPESLNETTKSQEFSFILITKALNVFKKGDYKNAPTIEYRIRKCEREIKSIEGEIKDLEKHPDVAKQVTATYTMKAIISSISRLGVVAFIGITSGALRKMNGKANVALTGLSGAKSVYDAATYEKQLKRYLNGLHETKEYLEKELSKTKIDDKNREEKNKSNSINEHSISDLKLG